MNLANRLTVSRFFLSLAFRPRPDHQFPAQLPRSRWSSFLIAGITDYADGEIARRFHMESDFGRLMDPLVDKIMMAAAFICLVPLRAIPAWAATVIVSREFLITGLRLLAASKGRVLSAEKLGKHKTAWQIVTAIFFLLMLSVSGYANLRDATTSSARLYWRIWDWGGAALLLVTVALTLISGAGYMWKNRAIIQ